MVRFGACTLDLDARRLFRGDREVHLSPKAFELLKVLVENRPRAVAKTELLDRVWAGVFVSESSLARAVTEIRAGIGDAARDATIVRTVHGYGYAFCADVRDDDEPAGIPASGAIESAVICWLTSADRDVPLPEGDHIAGRDPAATVRLDSPRVSRRHARFTVRGQTVVVEDLGSKNGTFVNGTRVEGVVALTPGDRIRIGPFASVFRVDVASCSTESEVTARFPPVTR